MSPIKSVHPFADAFPMMTGDEMDRLVEDIKQEGQIEPCIVNAEGVLLDGRNRLAACERLGIDPVVRTVSPASETAFIASLNIHRRHMTVGERQALAPMLEESFRDEARKRMLAGVRRSMNPTDDPTAPGQEGPSTAMAQAAKALDISERAGYRAKRVAEHAPELLEEVKAGTLTSRPPNAKWLNVWRRIAYGRNLSLPKSMRRSRRLHASRPSPTSAAAFRIRPAIPIR